MRVGVDQPLNVQITRMHSSRMRTIILLPYGGSPGGQRTQRTENPLDRDALERETPTMDTDPLDRDPLDRDPLDRDPPGQRPPWTETPLDRDPLVM